jgi:peptidoglycan/xylan/chitin deacetylase (PgdA/CDA1 family)
LRRNEKNREEMIRNFLFHRVNPQRDKLWDPMDPELFDLCIRYITRHYRVVLLEDIAFSNDLFSKINFATIMFDDGYKDNIEYALPILEKYNCKASFYVVTDCIQKNIPTWTHILEHSFQFTNISNLELTFDFMPKEFHVKELSTYEERISYIQKLKPFLKKLPHEKRNLVLDKISTTYTDIEIPELMMNWDDLKRLRESGHYIGSHTVSHCMLGTMTNETEIQKELFDSGKMIENKLGYFPLTISYPVGSYNEITINLSKKNGYKIGLAVKQNVYNPLKENLFEVSRIELYNEPWWKTRLRITNTLENLKTFIGYR